MRIETSKLDGFGVDLQLDGTECDIRLDAQQEHSTVRLRLRFTPGFAVLVASALATVSVAAEHGEQAVEQVAG